MKRAPRDFRVFLNTRRGAWTGIIVGSIVAGILLPHAFDFFILINSDGGYAEFVVRFLLLLLFSGGVGLALGGIVTLVHIRKHSRRR